MLLTLGSHAVTAPLATSIAARQLRGSPPARAIGHRSATVSLVDTNPAETTPQVLDGQVEKLRGEYDAYAKSQNTKIEQRQATIDANRKLLKHQIEVASADLESKQKDLEEHEKSLLDVKKVLHGSKGISLSKQEKQKWEERSLLLSEKIQPLADMIQELKLQIRLKKQKIHFLQ